MNSKKARRNEFTTNALDTPLITQFAANTVHDFVGAAHLVAPYCNGVDLNCGCPQRWAKEQGLGCEMLKKPELIYDIVRQCRNTISKPFTVSVKMRLLKDLKDSVNICKQLEMCGVSYLSVHARTSHQITGKINKEAIKLIKENCNIPIVANGGITSLEQCSELKNVTNCDGCMVANGLLSNPTLLSGKNRTTLDCIQNWLDICYNSTLTQTAYEKQVKNPTFSITEKPYNLTFQCFHHHLVFMLERVLTKCEKKLFNNLNSFSTVLDFIQSRFNVIPRLYDSEQFLKSVVLNVDYSGRDAVYADLKPINLDLIGGKVRYDCETNDGNFFKSKIGCNDI
ncbi:hypothetical protein NQ317_015110 [Molorchus minor]|uniref:DUS-like FMN-binding domain-containing protein n=1 Tax=Molorchus minor TaxID=1323400 RepID=A0ABQ9K6G2_9CUCU|nr:hypothetical protein NQ317_015110 [Molorchus minor]